MSLVVRALAEYGRDPGSNLSSSLPRPRCVPWSPGRSGAWVSVLWGPGGGGYFETLFRRVLVSFFNNQDFMKPPTHGFCLLWPDVKTAALAGYSKAKAMRIQGHYCL